MKTLYAIVVHLVIGASATSAQMVEFAMSFKNTSPTENRTYNFTFAAHPRGTNDLDKDLGETEIPSLPPPAGVYIVYTVPPAPEYIWLSPKDVRKLRSDSAVRHDYDVNITWTGGTLAITWNTPLPPLIDSAYLVDVLTDFPDNIIKVKIEPGASYTTTNPAITRLKVLVWYKANPTSVEETPNPNISIAPNPVQDKLELRGVPEGSTVNITDLCGAAYGSFVNDVRSVNTSMLIPGVYAVIITEPSGRTTRQLFVRQ